MVKTSSEDDYSDFVMKPPVPLLNLEDYGGPRHQILVDIYTKAIREVMDREHKALKKLQAEGKVGRNAPCPCGSGKKYKKCHGAAR